MIPVHEELFEKFRAAFAMPKARRKAVRRINNAIARMVMEKGHKLSAAVFEK